MKKTTVHVWIAMLICIAAMVSHADSDSARATAAAHSQHSH